ncbi:hypothetical protein M885DRAFT_562025 [Pelagophyceae sp. CCMP2097]|nr:hypothetical protein M885DRAFT_562025 [Pelagophyceae sp. CCMP2097]
MREQQLLQLRQDAGTAVSDADAAANVADAGAPAAHSPTASSSSAASWQAVMRRVRSSEQQQVGTDAVAAVADVAAPSPPAAPSPASSWLAHMRAQQQLGTDAVADADADAVAGAGLPYPPAALSPAAVRRSRMIEQQPAADSAADPEPEKLADAACIFDVAAYFGSDATSDVTADAAADELADTAAHPGSEAEAGSDAVADTPSIRLSDAPPRCNSDADAETVSYNGSEAVSDAGMDAVTGADADAVADIDVDADADAGLPSSPAAPSPASARRAREQQQLGTVSDAASDAASDAVSDVYAAISVSVSDDVSDDGAGLPLPPASPTAAPSPASARRARAREHQAVLARAASFLDARGGPALRHEERRRRLAECVRGARAACLEAAVVLAGASRDVCDEAEAMLDGGLSPGVVLDAMRALSPERFKRIEDALGCCAVSYQMTDAEGLSRRDHVACQAPLCAALARGLVALFGSALLAGKKKGSALFGSDVAGGGAGGTAQRAIAIADWPLASRILQEPESGPFSESAAAAYVFSAAAEQPRVSRLALLPPAVLGHAAAFAFASPLARGLHQWCLCEAQPALGPDWLDADAVANVLAPVFDVALSHLKASGSLGVLVALSRHGPAAGDAALARRRAQLIGDLRRKAAPPPPPPKPERRIRPPRPAAPPRPRWGGAQNVRRDATGSYRSCLNFNGAAPNANAPRRQCLCYLCYGYSATVTP